MTAAVVTTGSGDREPASRPCLWACAHALGIAVSPLALLTSFTLTMAGSGISLLPAGLGVVD